MHSVSNSRRWRRALSHQLQRRAAGCSRQRVRCLPPSRTGRGRAAPPPTARSRPWASWPLQWRRHSTVLASSHRPTRPTDPVERSSRARHSTDPVPARVSGARIRRQGAERAGPACFRRACSTPVRARRIDLRILWPWRPSAVTVVTVVSVRPSRVRLAPRPRPCVGGVSFVALTVLLVCL